MELNAKHDGHWVRVKDGRTTRDGIIIETCVGDYTTVWFPHSGHTNDVPVSRVVRVGPQVKPPQF